MAQVLKLALAFLLLGTSCRSSWAAEDAPNEVTPPPGLYANEDEKEGLLEFFKRRTQLGVGFDEEYTDNLLYQDNKKQDEWISTVESLLLFNDPRGSILYGTRWEVNAFRYHHSNNNAIDHDFLAYFDLDPGGRIRLHAEYGIETQHQLVFTADDIDLLRRSNEFQQLVTTTWKSDAAYALNETNRLVPQLSYTILDDQTVGDRETDRRTLNFNLDLDHDLTPTWVLFGGYVLTDVVLPKNRTKNGRSHGGRIGLRHDLSEIETLRVSAGLLRTEMKDGSSDVDPAFDASWDRKLGPRTTMTFSYHDGRTPSFSSGRKRFRTQTPQLGLSYELTPVIELKSSVSYNRQTSRAQDDTSSSPHSQIFKSYGLTAGMKWFFSEQGYVTLDYRYARAFSRDTTNHNVVLGFETTF